MMKLALRYLSFLVESSGMLKIKLARFGKRNQPHYRIVVNEARDKRW